MDHVSAATRTAPEQYDYSEEPHVTARLTCADCGEQIPNGQAYLRSVALERAAFCCGCHMLRMLSLDGDPSVRFSRGGGVVIREARALQSARFVADAEAHANQSHSRRA